MTSQSVELSASQARELTDRIKVGVEAIWELVKQAFQSRAWAALGYDSWDDYCTREFGTSRIRLPREERQEVVASMREIGMSTRAIASATGVSQKTISRDTSGESFDSPAPVTGTDGKTYTPKPRPEPEEEPTTPEWEEVGNIPQSRLGNLAPASGFNPGDLEELNTPTSPREKAPEPPTPDKQGDNLNNILDQLNMALETLETLNLETATTANKKEALKKIEQANRTLNNIKKRLR